MRKLIWGATALSVAAALGLYCASDYAARYPNSTFGRAFVNAAVYSPVGFAMGWNASPVNCCDCQPADGHAVAQPSTPGDTEASEAVETIRVEILPICPVEPENFTISPETVEPKIGTGQGPYSLPVEQPPAMPYAPEDIKHKKLLDEEFGAKGYSGQAPGLFGVGVVDLPIPISSNPPPANEEQSEPAGPGRNLIPDFREDPAYHHHYDGCPYLGNPRSYFPAVTPFPLLVPPSKPEKNKGGAAQRIDHQSMRLNLSEERGNPSRLDTMDYRPREDGPALPNSNQPF